MVMIFSEPVLEDLLHHSVMLWNWRRWTTQTCSLHYSTCCICRRS